MSHEIIYQAPHESYLKLFARFLKFGLLAWGGPVAQIAMIRAELVDDEKWIAPERFNRVLAVYQALPGPEAHELCVYFGMLARGRLGALLAGLGFMLPGFTLMLALSWFYVTVGTTSPIFQSIFLGMSPAVAALIVRAAHRIGGHALQRNTWLWAIAVSAAIAQLLEINFLAILFSAGFFYALIKSGRKNLALTIGLSALTAFAIYALRLDSAPLADSATLAAFSPSAPTTLALFLSGLRAGLLTFGGAYTAIPFLQHDAVQVGGWLTNAQFLDGIALSGLLPAPLIIFSTFVGYISGGLSGAFAMTIGIFAPAFAITMLGHDALEKLVENQNAHAFLDGVTAAVVGLIAATALGILRLTIVNTPAGIIFALALFALFHFKSKWTVAAVVLGAGMLGALFL